MIYLNLDPKPVSADHIVALTPEASVVSLGEVRLPGRRLQARRTTELTTGRSQDYLVDSRGNGYYLERSDFISGAKKTYQATSQNTGKPLTANAAPARFRYIGARIVLA